MIELVPFVECDRSFGIFEHSKNLLKLIWQRIEYIRLIIILFMLSIIKPDLKNQNINFIKWSIQLISDINALEWKNI